MSQITIVSWNCFDWHCHRPLSQVGIGFTVYLACNFGNSSGFAFSPQLIIASCLSCRRVLWHLFLWQFFGIWIAAGIATATVLQLDWPWRCESIVLRTEAIAVWYTIQSPQPRSWFGSSPCTHPTVGCFPLLSVVLFPTNQNPP